MWCSKVLVAYDGSAPSAKALHLARSIGAQDESCLLYTSPIQDPYKIVASSETMPDGSYFNHSAPGTTGSSTKLSTIATVSYTHLDVYKRQDGNVHVEDELPVGLPEHR